MSETDNEKFIALLKSAVKENRFETITNEYLLYICKRARSIDVSSKKPDSELSRTINILLGEIKKRGLSQEISNYTNTDKKKETLSKVAKQSPKLSIDIIFNNPFRILGLLVNATEREIAKQANDLKMCFDMGKAPKVKIEVPYFPVCERNSEIVEEAKKKIERSENRFLYSFFWYSNGGSVNQLALDVLSEGRTEKAIELWEKALSKYMVASDNIEKSIQPTNGEIDAAIIDNFLMPYLMDNYEIAQTLSDIFNGTALRDALRILAVDVREEYLDSNDELYYAVSDDPIGMDDNGKEIELFVEIKKTAIDELITDLSNKNLILPEKDFSCAKNLMVLYLGLAFKENELNFNYFNKALHLSGRVFHSRKTLNQYAALMVGTHYRHDNGADTTKSFIDEILKCVKPLLDNNISGETLKGIAKSFDLFPDTFRKEAIAKLTNRPIQNIKNKVAKTVENRKKNHSEANIYGEKLYVDTYDTLIALKDILSKNSLQYQNISDEVADEITSCSIDYFNKNKEPENNIDSGDDALKLAKYADSIAIDTQIKDRIHKGMPVLEEWVKDKPVRERRKKAAPHVDYIVKQLNGLPDPDKVLPNELIIADRFLEKCRICLNSLKAIYLVGEINIIPLAIILEQFENNENKWPENKEGDFFRKIEGGKYVLQSTNEINGHWSWGANHLDFSKFYNFTFECSIKKIKGTNDQGFGIVWSYEKKDDNTRYFKFCISGNGHYYFKELYNQEWIGGFQWTASEHIVHGDETNVLTVRKHGNTVNFYINDKLIVIDIKMPGKNMMGNGIGFSVGSEMTIEINYLYFCNAYVPDFSIIFDYNYYMSLSSAVTSRALDFCIAYANRTHDMEKPIMLLNKIQQIDMVPELRKRFGKNEEILKSNLRIKEENTPPLVKLFKKVSKWL